MSNVHLKLGIDGGGGYFRIKCTGQKYQDGVASKKCTDSGMKKLFILGQAQSSQENYENVSQLWSQ